MSEREKLQSQGLKTIREAQESMQQHDSTMSSALVKDSEQDALREYVKETQRILDGSIEQEGKRQNIPDLTHARTIKESMRDWIDENDKNIQKFTFKEAESSRDLQDSERMGQQFESMQSVSKGNKTIIINSKTQSTVMQKATALDSNAQGKTELKQQMYRHTANAKQETWLILDEFLKLSGLEREKVVELIKDKTIKSKQEGGKIYIEASTGTSALIKKVENRLVSLDMSGNALDPVFVEKTIATILGLHDKVLSSKDETIAAFKSENSFLKEALVSMQEIYDDDKKTIEILRQQLQKTQEEIEFVKRKYKLMWGKVSNSTT